MQEWLASTPSRHIAERKQQLEGLRYVDATANFFEPAIAIWADACLAAAGQPWRETMKPLSMRGFDMHNNRKVDYGDFQYRVVMHMWGLSNPRILDSMVRAAGAFAALHPDLPDTPRVLDRQGDVVEILMAMCRGDKSYGLYDIYITLSGWLTSTSSSCFAALWTTCTRASTGAVRNSLRG